MSTAVFDTLAYAKKLKEAGVPEKQAEIHAEAIAEIVEDKLATKRDLKDLEVAVQRDIKELEVTVQRDIKELELRLIIKLGSLIAASIAIVAALVKLL
ncbi:hypothetical protein [Dissulfurispira sp.]|uniref:hypothetical protein n=1 Tax=Dissulfurispira sp. TaxID=2817609 RepID=UPI002FDAE5A9